MVAKAFFLDVERTTIVDNNIKKLLSKGYAFSQKIPHDIIHTPRFCTKASNTFPYIISSVTFPRSSGQKRSRMEYKVAWVPECFSFSCSSRLEGNKSRCFCSSDSSEWINLSPILRIPYLSKNGVIVISRLLVLSIIQGIDLFQKDGGLSYTNYDQISGFEFYCGYRITTLVQFVS